MSAVETKTRDVLLINSHNVLFGDNVHFKYHKKVRVGIVEDVNDDTFLLRHLVPENYGGKEFSSYFYNEISSDVILRISYE